MIILVENEEDRIALKELYDWTEFFYDINNKNIPIFPLYEARIINIEKEPQA